MRKSARRVVAYLVAIAVLSSVVLLLLPNQQVDERVSATGDNSIELSSGEDRIASWSDIAMKTEPERLEAQVSKADSACNTLRTVTKTPVERQENELNAHKISLRGIVIAPENIDLSEFLIVVQFAEAGSTRTVTYSKSINVDTGEFSIELAECMCRSFSIFTINPVSQLSSEAIGVQCDSDNSIDPLTLRVKSPIEVKGVVISSSGEPIAGATIFAVASKFMLRELVLGLDSKATTFDHSESSEIRDSAFTFPEVKLKSFMFARATTDDSGEFTLKAAYGSKTRYVAAFASNFEFALEPLQSNLELTLRPAHRIEVSVIDYAGQAIANGKLEIVLSGDGADSLARNTDFPGFFTTILTREGDLYVANNVMCSDIELSVKSADYGFVQQTAKLTRSIERIELRLEAGIVSISTPISVRPNSASISILTRDAFFSTAYDLAKQNSAFNFPPGEALVEVATDSCVQSYGTRIVQDAQNDLTVISVDQRPYTIYFGPSRAKQTVYHPSPIVYRGRRVNTERGRFCMVKIGKTDARGMAQLTRFPGPCMIAFKAVSQDKFEFVDLDLPEANMRVIDAH